MTAGKMDRRITLQRATATDDGFSTAGSLTWSDIAKVWAEVEQIKDGERWRAGAVEATVTHRFRIRYSSAWEDLGAEDRVIYQGREFNISGVKELGRREKMEITASAEDG
jgi:SPP1 family predicted phage head-tail adaptor